MGSPRNRLSISESLYSHRFDPAGLQSFAALTSPTMHYSGTIPSPDFNHHIPLTR
jgi:hypothetical protein